MPELTGIDRKMGAGCILLTANCPAPLDVL
jgi:hypothetical protein